MASNCNSTVNITSNKAIDAIILVDKIILPVILLFGVVGNFAFIFTIIRIRHMRTIINYYLLNLCVADSLVIAIGIPLTFYSFSDFYNDSLGFCYAWTLFVSMPNTVSCFTLLLLAFERYMAVCHPIWWKIMASGQRHVFIIVATWIVSLLLSPLELVACHICLSKSYDIVMWSYYVIIYLTTLCSVCTLYILLILRLKKNDSVLGRTRINQDKRRVIVLLSVTTAVFMICTLPETISYLLLFVQSFGLNLGISPLVYIIYINFSRILTFTNSAVNTYIYSATSPRYRQYFKVAFTRSVSCNCFDRAKVFSRSSKVAPAVGINFSTQSELNEMEVHVSSISGNNSLRKKEFLSTYSTEI